MAYAKNADLKIMLSKIITTLILIITLVIMFNVVLPTPVAVENVKKAQAQISATSTAATSTPETTATSTDESPTSDDDEDIPIPLPSDKLAASIVVVLAYYESGGDGDCTKPGASGETGCYQYLWDTWVLYSTDVLGYVPEKTNEMETYVTYGKVLGWLDQGLTPRQIFLIWNQGHPGPCRSGVNSKGVPYDSCFYADRGVNKLLELTGINGK